MAFEYKLIAFNNNPVYPTPFSTMSPTSWTVTGVAEVRDTAQAAFADFRQIRRTAVINGTNSLDRARVIFENQVRAIGGLAPLPLPP